MTEEEKAALSERMIDMLLALDFQDREDVFARVRFNDVFCVHCGWGSREKPNGNCQCTNDE